MSSLETLNDNVKDVSEFEAYKLKLSKRLQEDQQNKYQEVFEQNLRIDQLGTIILKLRNQSKGKEENLDLDEEIILEKLIKANPEIAKGPEAGAHNQEVQNKQMFDINPLNTSKNNSRDSFDLQNNDFGAQSFDQDDQEEMDYLQKELTRIATLNSEPLMQRRKKSVKTDPVIELVEVHTDVREIESNLQKSLHIARKYFNPPFNPIFFKFIEFMIDKKIKAENKCQAAERSLKLALSDMQIMKEFKKFNDDDIKSMNS